MQLVAYGAQDVYLKSLQGRKTSGNIEKIRYSIKPFVDPFRTTDVNQGFVYDRQMKNPGKKIKLLETPKTYSTKQLL